MKSLYQELLAGFGERGQDEDGVDGDGPGFPRALVASLDPATLLGELVVFDHHDEFSLPEAEQGGVVCGGGDGGDGGGGRRRLARGIGMQRPPGWRLTSPVGLLQGDGVLGSLGQAAEEHGDQLGHVLGRPSTQAKVALQGDEPHRLA